jgi:hypothetical protein
VAPAIFETSILDRSWSGTLIAHAWRIALGAAILFGALLIGSRKKGLPVR